MLDCHWILIIHFALYINRYGILVLIYSFSYTNFFNALFNSFLSLCHYIIFFMMVIWLFHDGHLTFSRWSPDFSMMVTWLFHDGQLTFSKWSADFLNVGKLLFQDDPLTFSLWSPDFLTMVTWLSHNGHLTFSMWSPNFLTMVTWLSQYGHLTDLRCLTFRMVIISLQKTFPLSLAIALQSMLTLFWTAAGASTVYSHSC